MKHKTLNDLWNKCHECGRIIPYADFASGKALNRMISPDSAISGEEWEVLCHKHYTPDANCPGRSAPAHAPAHAPVPRRPWLVSSQYGMQFILSQDNEIIWRADWMPMDMLRVMVKAVNDFQAPKKGNEYE